MLLNSYTLLIIKNIITVIYGSWFIYIGVQHFLDPEWFEPIVPSFLGFPKFWVLVSGFLEIVLGMFLIIPLTRKFSGVCLVLFLIIIYIANINMWILLQYMNINIVILRKRRNGSWTGFSLINICIIW